MQITRTTTPRTDYARLNEYNFKARIDRALGGWSLLLPKRVIRALYYAIKDEVDLGAYLATLPNGQCTEHKSEGFDNPGTGTHYQTKDR